MCVKHMIECVVYRATYDAQNAQRVRNVQYANRIVSIYALRDDTQRMSDAIAYVRDIDNVDDATLNAYVETHKRALK